MVVHSDNGGLQYWIIRQISRYMYTNFHFQTLILDDFINLTECQAKTESTFRTIIQHNSVFWSCDLPTPTPTLTPTNTHSVLSLYKENYLSSILYVRFLYILFPFSSCLFCLSYLFPLSFSWFRFNNKKNALYENQSL